MNRKSNKYIKLKKKTKAYNRFAWLLRECYSYNKFDYNKNVFEIIVGANKQRKKNDQ